LFLTSSTPLSHWEANPKDGAINVITCLLDVLHPFDLRTFFSHYDVTTLVLRPLVAPFNSNEVDWYNKSLMEVKSILIPASSSSFADSSFLRRDRRSFKRS
jgi:hypothetical protein